MASIKLADESSISAARRLAMKVATKINFNENDEAKLAIIVTELATNLIKHTGKLGGELVFNQLEKNFNKGVEILALDKGPGITNITQCLQDGYSTTGTAGTGLGAIARLSTLFNIYSQPGGGTVVLSQLWSECSEKHAYVEPFEIGGICIAKPGEQVCGDAWAIVEVGQRLLALVIDGLGHGVDAATASQLACGIFKENKHLPLLQIMAAINQALRKTRGAAAMLGEINFKEQIIRVTGAGNLMGLLMLGNETRHIMCPQGIVGLCTSSFHEMVYPWHEHALLLIHTDGLVSRWDLNQYPGIITRHPSMIAGALYRDLTRGYDDVTVVAIRSKARPSIA